MDTNDRFAKVCSGGIEAEVQRVRHDMKRSIEAVVELVNHDREPPWPIIAEYPDRFIRIYPGLNHAEIGSLMLTACLYNRAEIFSTSSETLAAFIAKNGFVLPGGLRFSEEGHVKIVPGCCGGLEDWREWLEVPHGRSAIWAGHDPSPELEYFEGGVRIWQDQKAEGVDFIEISLKEMETLLRKVEQDLEGFLFRFGKWIDDVSPELKEQLVDYFIENLNIRNKS